jgi:hypothetical protein
MHSLPGRQDLALISNIAELSNFGEPCSTNPTMQSINKFKYVSERVDSFKTHADSRRQYCLMKAACA